LVVALKRSDVVESVDEQTRELAREVAQKAFGHGSKLTLELKREISIVVRLVADDSQQVAHLAHVVLTIAIQVIEEERVKHLGPISADDAKATELVLHALHDL